MNKIKLLYDVVKTMKEKEVFNGTLRLEGKKNLIKVFSFVNEFEKNTLNGQTKAKISTELDFEGKKVKHESSTEFNKGNCHDHMFHGLKRLIHDHHNHNDRKCGGIKEKLSKLAFVLDTMNNMKIDEQADKTLVLSLNISELPENMKKIMHERINNKMMSNHHGHHCMKEIFTMENSNIELNIWINKNNEVEKIVVTVNGKQKDELADLQEINLRGELSFAW